MRVEFRDGDRLEFRVGADEVEVALVSRSGLKAWSFSGSAGAMREVRDTLTRAAGGQGR